MEPLPAEEWDALDALVEAEVKASCSQCCSSTAQNLVVTSIRRLTRGFVWTADNIMYLLGWVFVPLAWILIGGILYSWYKVLGPYVYQEWSGAVFVLHFLFAHWLLVNIAFNYLMVTITSPGQPPQTALNDSVLQEGESFCKKCDNMKPARTHHCSVCRRCVLKMDHHCPWVHNCIGFRNHRYFFLFMAYLWVGCLYVAATCYPLFCLRYRWRHRYSDLSLQEKIDIRRLLTAGYMGPSATFSFILTVTVAVALGLLLFWHLYLISKGQTTIEFYTVLQPKSDKHKGGNKAYVPPAKPVRQRWREFLGIDSGRSIRGVLFPSVFRPSGDGITWSNTHQRAYWV